MFKRIFDRLIFGGLLIITLQTPMLADHYLQYLSGFHDGTAQQVMRYENNARQHGYDSAESMITALLQEANSIVRLDAEQKLAVIEQHHRLETALDTLSSGHLIDKALYMFNPLRADELQRVLIHFKPGIPIDIPSIAICVVMALSLNAILYLPVLLLRRQRYSPPPPTSCND
ncbi:hypothetical protein RJ45_15815 [Photobacterium gaetbulicola]|uniref:DUF2937 domain-containing protein n=1 Tax=Photobacterium gaetbulicola TaxID=1295392 RepID=A0A0B9H1R0_9GAMM|nr:DUF2937 family protein [Photobacterium gaetbulicola]KHT62712.1 hypothetical protein RJ45_15815 [Photobacterium gaetbulicola]